MKKLMMSLLIGLAITGAVMQYATNVKADISRSVVRLHVLANSNSKEDQELKLLVRDKVIEYLKPKLENSASVEQTKQIISKEIENIIAVSEKEIRDKGYQYKVHITTGAFDFPTKQYGDAQLPAGRYDALRILIGSGEGENWWCVLYPQLCFVNNKNAMLPLQSKQKLKNVLTEDEYRLITDSKNGGLSVKFKFKILELMK